MTELSSPPQGAMSVRRAWVAFAVLALPLLLVSMDVSILYFAVPQISADLHASATEQLWIFDVYGFVLAGLLITMGGVADRIGPRRLLLIGAAAFSATSLLAAYAGSPGQLIAARAVLGVAGATLMPSTLSMLRTLFPDERDRARAVAAWTGVMTTGVGLGPVVSGVLLQHFWWGSVFLVNLPAMALLLVAGPLLLPAGARRADAPFDVVGSLLSLAGVLATIYGIKESAAHGADALRVAAVVVGLGILALFVRRLRVHAHPMIDPALLRNRAFLGAVGGNVVCSFALIGNAVFMTAYLQLVLGHSALTAALWSLVPTAGVAAAAPFAAPLGERLGRPRAAALGLAVAACGFLVLTRVGTDALVPVLVGGGVLATGLVVTMTTCAELVLAALRPEEAGAGSAVSEAATELGGALGIALLGSLGAAGYRGFAADRGLDGPEGESLAGAVGVAARLPEEAGDHVLAVARAAYVHGLHVAAVAGAVLLVVAAVTAWSARPAAARSPERSGS